MMPNNQPANGNSRLSMQMLATADGLKDIRLRLHELATANHPAIVDQHETAVILLEGLMVAKALETLGQRLEIHK